MTDHEQENEAVIESPFSYDDGFQCLVSFKTDSTIKIFYKFFYVSRANHLLF